MKRERRSKDNSHLDKKTPAIGTIFKFSTVVTINNIALKSASEVGNVTVVVVTP